VFIFLSWSYFFKMLSSQVLMFPKRILSKEKTRSTPADFFRHREGDQSRIAPGPDFGVMAFPPTEESFSEVVDIAVVDGKATGSSDIGSKVALQRCHEVRPLPKRIDFGKPRHELRGDGLFSDLRRVEELHELAEPTLTW
jgi:hypothetical protein